jgi:hypothetical protein
MRAGPLDVMAPKVYTGAMTDAGERDRMGEAQGDLELTLEDLRAYRKRDPDFERAIAEFIEAEATEDDPAEGRVVTQAAPPKQRRSES